MKKRIITMAIIAAMSVTALASCGESKPAATEASKATAAAKTETTTTTSTGVSDEAFAGVQEVYAQLVTLHDTIADAVNSGQLTLDAESTEAVNQAAELIAKIGDIDKSDFKDDAEAVEAAELMGDIAEVLSALVEVNN